MVGYVIIYICVCIYKGHIVLYIIYTITHLGLADGAQLDEGEGGAGARRLEGHVEHALPVTHLYNIYIMYYIYICIIYNVLYIYNTLALSLRRLEGHVEHALPVTNLYYIYIYI